MTALRRKRFRITLEFDGWINDITEADIQRVIATYENPSPEDAAFEYESAALQGRLLLALAKNEAMFSQLLTRWILDDWGAEFHKDKLDIEDILMPMIAELSEADSAILREIIDANVVFDNLDYFFHSIGFELIHVTPMTSDEQ